LVAGRSLLAGNLGLLLCVGLAFCVQARAQSTGIYVNSSNNVGIGTTSPASDAAWAIPALDISGTRGTAIIRTTLANGNTTLRMTGPGASHIDDWDFNVSAGSTSLYSIYPQGGNIGAAFTIKNNGQVGIGTASPAARLSVANSLGNVFVQIGGQGGAPVGQRALSIGYGDVYNGVTMSESGYIQAEFQGVSYKPLLLDPLGGNVGIGTVNPGAKLEVNGGSLAVKPSISTNGYAGNQSWRLGLCWLYGVV
jgi:hypothetical protein